MGLQFGGIAVVLGGDKIFPALGMEMPQVLVQMREKKMGVVMGIYLLGNALQNQLSATGAFEVFYDGKQVCTLYLPHTESSIPPIICSFLLADFGGTEIKAALPNLSLDSLLQRFPCFWHVISDDDRAHETVCGSTRLR